MTKNELELLYKEKILPLNQDPYHFEVPEKYSSELKAYNPMCGDKFDIYLDLDKNKIKNIWFYGIGCAISKASTSVLAKTLEGMEIVKARELCGSFLDTLDEGKTGTFEIEELAILVGLKDFDGRKDCIKLGWIALWRELGR